MSERDLTERQRRFVLAYAETGNATEAAERAGYTGTRKVLEVTGYRLLRNAGIAAELAKVARKAEKRAIASIEEVREFWSEVMTGDEVDMKDRLKASELLAKAAGAFVERREVSGSDGGPLRVVLSAAEVEAGARDGSLPGEAGEEGA